MSEVLSGKPMAMPQIEIINEKVMMFNDVDSCLEQLRQEADELGKLDARDKDSYKAIKTFANKLVKLRTGTDKKGKDAVEPFVNITGLIRNESKRIQEELKNIEAPLKAAYKAIDDEKKRLEAEKDQFLRDCLNWIQEAPNRMIGKSVEAITAEIDLLAETDLGDNWEGYLDLASTALTTSLNMLSQLQTMALSQEKMDEMKNAATVENTENSVNLEADIAFTPVYEGFSDTGNIKYVGDIKASEAIGYATKEDLSKSVLEIFEGISFEEGNFKITIEKV